MKNRAFVLLIAIAVLLCVFPALAEQTPEQPTLMLTPPQSGEAYYTGEVTTAVLTLPGAEYRNAAVLFHRDGDDWATEFYFDDAWQQDLSCGEKEIHVPAHGGQYDVFVIAQPAGSAEWVSISEIDTLFIEIESCGPVDKMEIDVPLTFDPANGLNVMMHAVDNAAWYTWTLYDEYWNEITRCDSAEKDGVLWHTEETDNFDANGVYEIVVPNVDDEEQSRFETGRCYVIEVIYGQDGWECRDESYYMCAADNAGTEPVTFMVKRRGDTEWTDDIEYVDIYEDFDIQISAPGATRVLIREKNGRFRTDEYAWDPYWFDLYQTGAFIDEEYATYTLYAVAYYEDEEGNIYTGTCSNTCTVSAGAAKGSTAVPVISLEKSTADRGERLPLRIAQGETVPEDEHEFRYGLRIADSTGETVFADFRFMETPDMFEYGIPTAMLENGREYTVFVNTNRTGCWWSEEVSLPFTVTENTVPSSLILPDGPVLTKQEFTYGINLTDMYSDEARIIVSGSDGYREEWYFDNWNGYYGTGTRWHEHTGVIDLRAQCMQWIETADEEGNPVTYNDWADIPGLTGTVELIAPYGRLDYPVIMNAPLMTEGEALNISFRIPDGAEDGHLSVSRNDAGGGWMFDILNRDWSAEEAEDGIIYVTVPGFETVAGDSYRIDVGARAAGYDSSNTGTDVNVIGRREEEHEITLTVDKTEVQSREEYVLTVEAPGASFMKLIRTGSRNGWAQLWTDPWDPERASYDRYIYRDWIESGSMQCWVIAYYGEVTGFDDPEQYEYTAVSSPVLIKAVETGNVPDAPTFEIVGLDENHQIERGQMLSVTVIPDAETDPDRLLSYEVMIHELIRDEWNEWAEQKFFRSVEKTGTEAFTVSAPTIALEPGKEYIVEVGVCGLGCDWRGGNTRSRFGYTFTVTDPAGSPDFFRLTDARETYVTGESVTVEIQTLQGYSNIKLTVRCPETGYDRWEDFDGRWDRNYGEMVLSLPEEIGTYELTIQGHDWSDWIDLPFDPLTVKVTAPNGSLEPAEILTSPLAAAGQPIDITFRIPEGAEYGDLSFGRNNEDGEDGYSWYHEWQAEDAGEDGIISVTVPDFEAAAGDRCHIHINARAYGYETSGAWMDISVTSETEEDHEVTLTVDKAEVLSREEFALTVQAPGATFVKLLWAGDSRSGSEHLWLNEWDPDQASYDPYIHRNWMESGSARCWALAYYGETGDGDDPEMYEYTAVSAPVTLKVTESGDVPDAPAFEVIGLDENHQIERGQMLSVTVIPDAETDPDRLLSYEVMIHELIRDEWNEWVEQKFFRSVEKTGTEAFTVSAPTIALEPGKEYIVEVGVCGLGCNWRGGDTRSRFGYTFSVTEPAENPDFFRVKDARDKYLTGEDMTVEVQTLQGYSNIKLTVRCPENRYDRWEDFDGRWDRNYGEMTFDLPDEPGTYELTVQGHDWSDWIETPLFEPITIEVGLISDDAVLKKPVISGLPTYIRNENDFAFSFAAVENAERYNVEVWPDNFGGGNVHMQFTAADAENGVIRVQVPVGDGDNMIPLRDGGEYRVVVSAMANGYASGCSDNAYTMYVSEEMTRFELTADRNKVLAQENVLLTLSRLNPEWCYRLFDNGYEFRYESFAEEVELEHRFDSGTHEISARAYETVHIETEEGEVYDEERLTAVSNVVTLTVTSAGKMPAPVFDAPDSVTKGEPVTITVIRNEETYTGPCEYEIRIQRVIRREWGDDWQFAEEQWVKAKDGQGDISVRLPTGGCELADDIRYVIQVEIKKTGYDSNEAFRDLAVLPEEAGKGFTFEISDESTTIYSKFFLWITRESADSVAGLQFLTTNTEDENDRWTGDIFWTGNDPCFASVDLELATPGTYTFTLGYGNRDEWTEAEEYAGQTCTVTVEDAEHLEAPVLKVDPIITRGEDIVLTFNTVENAERYMLSVGRPETGFFLWLEGRDIPQPDENGMITITIPYHENSGYGEYFEPNGRYYANVEARSDYFITSRSPDCLFMLKEPEEEQRVTLSVDSNEKPVNGGDFIFTYSAPGANRAELQFIHDTGNWWSEELDLNDNGFRFGNQEPGHFQAYVIAYYGEDGAETVSVSNVVEFDRVVPCAHENLTEIGFISPTDDTEGSVACRYCPDCGMYYTDETAETRLDDADRIIPALTDMDVLRLPSSVTTIAPDAFSGIAAEAVIIPDACTAVGSGAFANCPDLRYVRIPAGAAVADDAFEGCPKVIVDRK